MRHHETIRDPITSVPIIARGKGDMPIRVQVPIFSHRSIFLRLGKQVLLDKQTERACPEDIVIAVYISVVSQGVLSSDSMTRISQWRYPRVSPEHPLQVSLEGRLGKNHEFSPNLLARRPIRLPVPFWYREEKIEDHPTDPRRIKVRRRVKDRFADPRTTEVPAPVRYLPRLDLMEEILFDRIEEWLYLKRGGQDKVYQPLGGKLLMEKIRTS